MKKKRKLLIVIATLVFAAVFGLSNSQSRELAQTVFEESPTPTLTPLPTPLPSSPVTQRPQSVQVTQSSIPKGVQAQVVRVVDGDTIRVLLNGEEKTVRLIGVNTPETVDPRKEVECYGKEASAYAKELMDGQVVYLESDDSQGDKDKYQRLLRYIWLDTETNVNELLIADGYAYEYTYDLPYKYQLQFQQAQQEAQAEERGLWASGMCK